MLDTLIAPLPMIINAVYVASMLVITYAIIAIMVEIGSFITHMPMHRTEAKSINKLMRVIVDAETKIEMIKPEVKPIAPRKRAPAKKKTV